MLKTALPYLICGIFFVAYGTLALVKDMHYLTGFDLGIATQIVWKYSRFHNLISTNSLYPDQTVFYQHVELIYAVLAPFYWLWSSEKLLLLLQAAALCSSGMALFLLARRRKLSSLVSIAVLIGYVGFYGVQQALWSDVHSAAFAAAFLAWFLYFLDKTNVRGAWIFFLLAITAKENIALLTLAIAGVYLFQRRDKLSAVLSLSSIAYLGFVYLLFYPLILQAAYPYQNENGLLSNLNPASFFDTQEKRQTLLSSLGSFGFLPLLHPLSLLPLIADLSSYFILASDLTAAHGIFLHYRVTLAPLLAWATINALGKYTVLNTKYIAAYLLIATLFMQYYLHLPLSYLTKAWFWHEPSGVKHINHIKKSSLPQSASVVSQINILPHISHRENVYALFPEKKQFGHNSPCGKPECNWFRWHNRPEYLFIDTAPEWDARHLLTNREDFIDGLRNLEKQGVIRRYTHQGSAVLYKVVTHPSAATERVRFAQ